MSWAVGFDDNWKRDIGYGVPAWCDFPGCVMKIHRGLAHVCGAEPYGGDRGCGLFFCHDHLSPRSLCARCDDSNTAPFPPSPDHPVWTHHKATHPSWAEWRASQVAKGT